jgi:uncharacterized membrane protein YphA (DoxX/SURF4 family)
MGWPIDVFVIRLFLRLLLGLILLSVGVSKFLHQRQFQQGIQEYKVLPPVLEARLALSAVLSYGIPLAELVAGLGLLSGLLLVPAALLALTLFLLFSGAILINLFRGRRDLSCHCGGALGDHHISWWLVGRNGLLIAALLFLLITPSDMFTVIAFVHSPSLLNQSLMSTIVPVVVLAGAVAAATALFNAARVLWRS